MSSNQMNIGKNIRAVRVRLKLTQQELADQCQLSKGMISKLENGVVVPAIATLAKIAQALHVKISDLIESDQQKPSTYAINPFSNLSQFIPTAMGYQMFNPAAGLKDTAMEPLLINADEATLKPHMVSHPGEEYIFVFSGEMTFKVGEQSYLLRRGDSVFFDGLQKHGIASVHQSVQYVDVFVGYSLTEKMEERE